MWPFRNRTKDLERRVDALEQAKTVSGHNVAVDAHPGILNRLTISESDIPTTIAREIWVEATISDHQAVGHITEAERKKIGKATAQSHNHSVADIYGLEERLDDMATRIDTVPSGSGLTEHQHPEYAAKAHRHNTTARRKK